MKSDKVDDLGAALRRYATKLRQDEELLRQVVAKHGMALMVNGNIVANTVANTVSAPLLWDTAAGILNDRILSTRREIRLAVEALNVEIGLVTTI